ncbi:MAG: DNA recombination protein RmuC [Gemmatimonadetes bacterium]|nr:DNA recombination protein RmuC [Gemmatimonadota bacterium]
MPDLLLPTLLALLLGLTLGFWLGHRPAAALRAHRDAAALELAALKAAQQERDTAHAAELARLQQTFELLAGQALDAAQRKLVEGAEQLLTRHREAAGQGLDANRTQLAELLGPVRDSLLKYETRLGEVEKARQEGYGQLLEAVKGVLTGQERVAGATTRLETALRSSGAVAGRWGEEQCRNVLEAAGLVEGIDFVAQGTVDGEAGRQRPDFVLTLPGGRRLVVDVKCSLADYVSATEAEDPAARATLLAAHARAVRTHAEGLARKDYAKGVREAVGDAAGDTVEFVVLFVPGENFLAAAVAHDRALLDDFFRKRVVLAGPVNLVAVARTVAALRDQARLAEEAQRIAKLGRELYDSLRIMGANFGAVQKALDGTVKQWNALVGQAESRVMLRARRFRELGAATGADDLAELAPVAQVPLLPGGELAGGEGAAGQHP